MDRQSLTNAAARLQLSRIDFFDSIDSTNAFALRLADTGESGPALVAADAQTSGRGRMNRRWITNPGSSLAFSLLIHPAGSQQAKLQLFSALASLAVCRVLNRQLGITAQIKWPNDILINRQKTAGILCEAVWAGESLQAVVIGIGINVTKGSLPVESSLQYPATYLEAHLADSVDRTSLLVNIVSEILTLKDELGIERFMNEYNQMLAFKDEPVRIIMGESVTGGTLVGSDPSGNLILDTGTGLTAIAAGDLHLRPETSTTGVC